MAETKVHYDKGTAGDPNAEVDCDHTDPGDGPLRVRLDQVATSAPRVRAKD